MYWNDRPGACVNVDMEHIDLDTSKVVIIPPNVKFRTRTDVPVGQLYLHFWLGLASTVPCFRVIVHSLKAKEQAHVRWLVTLLKRTGNDRDLTISLLSQLLITTVLVQSPAEHWDNWKVDAAIERVLKKLHDGSLACDDNEALAEEAGLGVNTMVRRFKRVTGTSPHQYAVRLRLEQGCDLLRDTELSLDQIAERVGFCDRFHFSRAFRAVLDDSPAQFRRRHRSEVTGDGEADEGRARGG
jgi:AraC-like DNA-binding protein